MKKYWYILRAGFMSILAYRANIFLNSISNAAYVVMIYFLWKAIYRDAGTINGMRFEQAFVYLALASTVFNIFKAWTEWAISSQIISGSILKDITRPIDFQLKTFFDSTSRSIFNALWIGSPVLAVMILWGGDVFVPDQLLFAITCMMLAYIINFQLDFIVGVTAFYTESIWGISLAKETGVLMLSGAVVPMAFFPDTMTAFLMYTPFPYIYHVPLALLTEKISDSSVGFQLIFCQIAWIAGIYFISSLFFKQAVKQVTVNGG